jgi:hypothetical protein
LFQQKFFADYCTPEMGIARPRDDKAATIRRMLEHSEAKPLYSDSHKIESDELSQGDGSIKMISNDVSFSMCDQDSNLKSESSVTIQRHCPDWICNLPPSLQGLYESQKNLSPKQSHSVFSSGTSPLRDVVVQMHNRVGAVIKFLPE